MKTPSLILLPLTTTGFNEEVINDLISLHNAIAHDVEDYLVHKLRKSLSAMDLIALSKLEFGLTYYTVTDTNNLNDARRFLNVVCNKLNIGHNKSLGLNDVTMEFITAVNVDVKNNKIETVNNHIVGGVSNETINALYTYVNLQFNGGKNSSALSKLSLVVNRSLLFIAESLYDTVSDGEMSYTETPRDTIAEFKDKASVLSGLNESCINLFTVN